MSKKKETNDYGPMDRKRMEGNEASEVMKTDLPDTRFSATAQVNTAAENVTPASDVAGSGIKKDIVAKQMEEIKSKVRIKPSASTEILDNTQVGGVPIGSSQAVAYSAGGVSKSPTTVEDSSRIPYTDGGYRPDSRFAKKTSDNDFLINNAISEQIAPKFEGSKDLREAPDSLQGYNGRKQFKTARGKKNAGNVPQSTLFDRSVDFIKYDATVHTTGQVLDNIDPQAAYPTETALANLELGSEGYAAVEDVNGEVMDKSNYILKTFNFSLRNGRLSSVSFNEDKVVSHCPENQTLQANVNWQIDRNNVAKTVIRLQKELGRETTDKWSALGYVLRQPYQFNMLAHDIEATTGAMMLAAYRAANTSLAYQSNNKLAKDGAKPQTPIMEMFLDGIGQTSHSISNELFNELGFEDTVFNKALFRKGSAAAIIDMFDSTGKYKTKANFFNLPRSLKYFVQTADNNINPLHCKKEFLMALDTKHTYSTTDGTYNPQLPIIATDKISIVNPLSLNYFLKGWNRDNANAENMSGTADVFAYKYGDLRNVYYQSLKHPLIEGLLSWMIKHEGALASTYGADADVEIPCFYSMLAPGMWQSMLCAASQEILWARNIYFKDFIFAGEQTEYIWKDLVSLSELNPKFSSNMTITDFKSPIKLGKLKPASFYQIFWGDTYTVAGADDPALGTKKVAVFQPWYLNEVSFKNSYDLSNGFYDDTSKQYNMSYPEVRIGVCHEYIDMIGDVSERDLRLALDRAVGIPIYVSPTEGESTTVYNPGEYTVSRINANIKVRSVRYDTNSDGRVVVSYDNDTDTRYIPNKAAIMALPREIGYTYPCMRVSPIVTNVRISGKDVLFDTTGSYQVGKVVDGSSGYSLVAYQAIGSGITATTISRTAAIQQNYVTCFADRSEDVIEINDAFVESVGLIPAISGLFKPAKDANAITFGDDNILTPFYALNSSQGATDLVDSTSIVTLARYMWSMLNRFFMPCNAFENCLTTKGDKEDFAKGGVLIDPMETSFMFGLAGFLASDFEQDILNRADIMDQLNIDYTEDEFVKSSLIFRAD